MSKLQMIALNTKDRSDLYALLEGCVVRDGDHRSIEPARVVALTVATGDCITCSN